MIKEYTVTGKDSVRKAQILLMQNEDFSCCAQEKNLPYSAELLHSLTPVHYCKIEKFPECLLGTMRIPSIEGRPSFDFGFYADGTTCYLIKDQADSPLVDMLSKALKSSSEADSPFQILLLLFEAIISEEVFHLEALEDGLSAIENQLLEEIPETFNQSIMSYQKKLTLLHSYYEQLMNAGDIMRSNLDNFLPENHRRYWDHFTARTERLHDHTETLREYLMQIRALYQSQIDAQQNRIVTMLTIITTIFLPLTLIAGWYGMNFPGMPEFSWKYGYIGVIAISVLIVIIEIIFFKRKKMF